MRRPVKPATQIVLILAGAAVVLGGLAGIKALTTTQLPSLAEVKDESHDVMEPIVELLPEPTARDWGAGSLMTCGDMFATGPVDRSAGFFYTGHWSLWMPGDFDGEAFIEGLPAALGDDYVVMLERGSVPNPDPHVDLRHVETRIPVYVTFVVDDDTGEKIIDIRALSRCAEHPDDAAE